MGERWQSSVEGCSPGYGEAGEAGFRVGRLSQGLVVSGTLSPSLSYLFLRTWPFIALASRGWRVVSFGNGCRQGEVLPSLELPGQALQSSYHEGYKLTK